MISGGDIAKTVVANQAVLDPIRQWILDHFGQNGLYAAYLLAAAAIGLLLFKVVRFSFELVFFVALPSVIAAFVLTFFLPYSFFYLVPATTALFTLGLVLKNVGMSKG
jgi:hypothetical protein